MIPSQKRHKRGNNYKPLFVLFLISVGGKLYENSHSHTATEMTSHGGPAGYKRPQSSSSGPVIGGVAAGGGGGGEDGAKKKKKGNWRNRYGPCFTTDAKPPEASPSLGLPTSSAANTCSSTASPSSSSSTLPSRPGLVSSGGLGVGLGGGERGLGVMGVCGGIQKSPSLLRNGGGGPSATGLGETASTRNTKFKVYRNHALRHVTSDHRHSNISRNKGEKRGLA